MEHTNGDAAAPADFWERRYADSGQVWSGRPNQVLVDIASSLEPGRALDLGCGEGADAIWLAQQGWDATGVDIAPTAVARATRAAADLGLASERIRFLAVDLGSWDDEGDYELVTASFLHSTVDLPRTDILRRAAGHVAAGGHLLVLSHAALPPWAPNAHGHAHRFLTPDEELDALALGPGEWDVVLAETRTRQATGPDGRPMALDDAVLLLRRR